MKPELPCWPHSELVAKMATTLKLAVSIWSENVCMCEEGGSLTTSDQLIVVS